MTYQAGAPTGPPATAWGGGRLGKRIGRTLLRVLPVRVYGRLFPRRVIGLCYHVVSDRELPHVRYLYDYKTPEQFEDDLVYLKRNYRVLSYPELEAELASGGSGGTEAAVITFDDGLAECYTVARPLLRKHGLSCIFFVSPPHVDNRRMFPADKASLAIGALQAMDEPDQRRALTDVGGLLGASFADVPAFARWLTTWIRTVRERDEEVLTEVCRRVGVDTDRFLREQRPYLTREQVRALASEGFTIGSHGMRHIALGHFSPEEVEAEIANSCREVAEMTGASRVPFAFPFDADGVDRELLQTLRSRHASVGLLFDTRQMKRDRDFIVNRMITDLPPRVAPGRSNLPGYLRSAYLDEILRAAGLPPRGG